MIDRCLQLRRVAVRRLWRRTASGLFWLFTVAAVCSAQNGPGEDTASNPPPAQWQPITMPKPREESKPAEGAPSPGDAIREQTNVQHGVASNGQLSTSGYTQMFEGQTGATSGGLDVVWTLAAPGATLKAGVYQVTLRWKLEAITP